MRRDTVEALMIVLGLASGALLVLYTLSAAGGSAQTDPLFWAFVVFFLGYVGWDVRRHLRATASRSASSERHEP